MSDLSDRIVDLGVVTIANLMNLIMVGIFLSRPAGLKRVERILGLAFLSLGLLVCLAVVLNLLAKREWWTVVLPMLLIAFCVVELLFDYVLKLDFRYTALLWPYLALYYLALLAMIGYAFGVGKPYGFVTLGTYFLNLLATWYSYSRVGHG